MRPPPLLTVVQSFALGAGIGCVVVAVMLSLTLPGLHRPAPDIFSHGTNPVTRQEWSAPPVVRDQFTVVAHPATKAPPAAPAAPVAGAAAVRTSAPRKTGSRAHRAAPRPPAGLPSSRPVTAPPSPVLPTPTPPAKPARTRCGLLVLGLCIG
jgi:hypothetical protein